MWHTRSARRPLWWWGRWLLSPQKLCPHRNLRNTPVYPFRLLHLQYCEGKLVLIPTILNSSRFEKSKSKSLKSDKSVTITRQSTAQPQNKMKQTKAKNTLLLHYVTQYSLTQFVIQCLPKMQLKIWTGILINYWEFLLSQLSVQYFCQVFHQLLLLKWEQIDVIIIW